jgi:hypothetical protein
VEFKIRNSKFKTLQNRDFAIQKRKSKIANRYQGRGSGVGDDVVALQDLVM